MKSILTVYAAKKGETPQRQYWHATLGHEYFSPSSGRIENVERMLQEWVGHINRITLRDSKIEFVPVNVADIPEGYNRTCHCGYREYGSSGQGEPIDPLIVRGKPLPELTAKPQWYPHLNSWDIHFRSTEYDVSLTPGQRTQLKEWFQAQLLKATSEDLLATVKARVLATAKKNVESFIEGQRDYCRRVEALAAQLL